MRLEAGWGQSEEGEEAPKPAPTTTAAPVVAAAAKASEEATEATFREAALEKGVHTTVIDILVGKLNGKWDAGLKTLEKKSADELNEQYMPAAEGVDEQW